VVLQRPSDSTIEYILLELPNISHGRTLLGCIYRPNRTIDYGSLLNVVSDISLKSSEGPRIFVRELHDVCDVVLPYLQATILLPATGVRSARLEVLGSAIIAFLSRRHRHSTFPGEIVPGYNVQLTLGNISAPKTRGGEKPAVLSRASKLWTGRPAAHLSAPVLSWTLLDCGLRPEVFGPGYNCPPCLSQKWLKFRIVNYKFTFISESLSCPRRLPLKKIASISF